MADGFFTWSQTDASNSSSDGTIGWAEGQSPPTVNNSARSMMARLAEYRDDLAGVAPSNAELISGGSANAQTLTTNATISPAALTHGWMVTFQAGYSNTSAVTLAVDGTTAKPIQVVAGSACVGGEIVVGRYYTVHYNQPDDAWIVHSASPITSYLIGSTAEIRAATADRLVEADNLWAGAEMVVLTDGANIAVDMSAGWNFTLTLTATGRTLDNPTSAKPGQSGFIRVTASGGAYTLAKGAGWLSTTTFPITVSNGSVKYIFYAVYTSAPVVVITGIITDPS